MNPEKFLAFIKKAEEEDKRYEGLYKAFSKKLPKELAEIVFAQLPKMKEKRDTVYDDVYKIAGKYIGKIMKMGPEGYKIHEWLNNQAIHVIFFMTYYVCIKTFFVFLASQ